MKQLLYIFVLLLYGCGGGGGDSDISASQPTQFSPNSTTQRPMLLIRLSYDNSTFHNDAVTWQRKMFGFNTHELNSYFQEVSYNHFHFIPVHESEGRPDDGIISITLQRPHPDSAKESSIHFDLAEAVHLADEYIDFAAYDSDHNGALSPQELQLIFIVAGNEDAYSGPNASLGVWAHASCTERSNTPMVDGVTLMGCHVQSNYALFGERHGTHDATIGIIAHELGHAAFNLPDLYDTTDESGGVGYFALMGAGMWGQNGLGDLPGATPTHLCAWSKTALQWVTPTTIIHADNLHVTMYASASETFNIIKLPISESEYFLVENRHNSGYDRGLTAISYYFEGGLAIWHIDENTIVTHFSDNTVNADAAHKGVDLEEAAFAVLDDSVNAKGNRENLFYSGNVDAFTPYTNPSSAAYNGASSGIYIESITSPSSVMSALISHE